jgi:hypothetical protein
MVGRSARFSSTMTMTTHQAEQLARIICSSFTELRERSRDQKAVADLAYASHNLPFLAINDHFTISGIRSQFESFHSEHGYRIFDFVAMMTTLERKEPPSESFANPHE